MLEQSPIELLEQFIVPEMMILVLVVWVLGVFLKKTPKIPNWSIVWILTLVGIIYAMLVLGLTPLGFAQGILATGFAVLGYDLVTQTKKGVDKK